MATLDGMDLRTGHGTLPFFNIARATNVTVTTHNSQCGDAQTPQPTQHQGR